MTLRFTTAALAAALSLSAGGAFAQSYTAPAGIPASAASASLGYSASPLVAQGYLPAYQDGTRAEPATTGSVQPRGAHRHVH
ncbi:hypothetical protein [Methylobacterium sp. sgz302541]|uniref:hypothetical protein n=1 Tax=unclassified Methylobacterium TaxID=2615210 RepID=UPI003D356219